MLSSLLAATSLSLPQVGAAVRPGASRGWSVGTLPGPTPPEHRGSTRVTAGMAGPGATSRQPRYLSSDPEGVETLGLSQ